MQLTTIPEILVLATGRILTIPEVATFSAQSLPALEADATAQELTFTGPWIFVSHNLPQDATTTFELQLCRSIAAPDAYAGDFEVLTLPEMPAGTLRYEGPLAGIFTEGYTPLLESLMTDAIPLSGEIREVYHQWTDPASPENAVEIQVGIVEVPAPETTEPEADHVSSGT